MTKKRNAGFFPVLIILMLLVATVAYLNIPNNFSTMKTSEAVDLFRENKVESYEINLGNGNVAIKLFGEEEEILYKVPDVTRFLSKIEPFVEEYNLNNPTKRIVYNLIPPAQFPIWLSILPTIVMLALVGFLFYNMYNQANGGGKAMSVGRAKTKSLSDVVQRKSFSDVAGADEEKEELIEIVEFLKDPKKFKALGAKIPRGVLLVGPPGTGKTLLAKATAGEAGVAFFSISGSDFVEMFVGVGASRVRDLFEKAKKSAPSIIFIDEIDAVGRQRGAGLGGGHDEKEQTLNQLLVEMDGFDNNEGVIVMGSTNRADILDRALLRPGRFDRQVYVGVPDIKGREDILKVHLKGKPIAPDVDIKKIARATPGFTGADLENLLNEAALLAAKMNKKSITQADIDSASIKVIAGPEKKSRVVTEKEKRLVSYHEAGHAIITYVCETGNPVKEISIIPRGMAGGYTLSLPEEDSNYRTKTQMAEEIVMLLGGRCAEKLILDDISTGASNDLERSTAIAKAMVTRYGFSEKIGNVVYGHNPQQTFLGRDYSQGQGYSEAIASEIDTEIRKIVEDSYQRCMKMLQDNIEKLHVIAKVLIRDEKISGEQFTVIMQPDYVFVERKEEIVKAEEIAQDIKEDIFINEPTMEDEKDDSIIKDTIEPSDDIENQPTKEI